MGKQTLANLSALPPSAVDAVRSVLAGKTLVEAEAALEVTRSLPHGHVALVHAQAKRLGLVELLGPPGRARDLALALIVARVVAPASKLSTVGWWDDVTLGHDLGVAGACTDEVYAAMDALGSRQDQIEAALARRHLSEGGIAMFDLSSSWMEGSCCELAARGYSRDGKKNKLQIEYGLLTDPDGRPIAIRVFAGNTGDPTAFIEAVDIVRDKFNLHRMVMVGDRGMITSRGRRARGVFFPSCSWQALLADLYRDERLTSRQRRCSTMSRWIARLRSELVRRDCPTRLAVRGRMWLT